MLVLVIELTALFTKLFSFLTLTKASSLAYVRASVVYQLYSPLFS
jgi:hypothetical protein